MLESSDRLFHCLQSGECHELTLQSLLKVSAHASADTRKPVREIAKDQQPSKPETEALTAVEGNVWIRHTSAAVL